MFHRNNFFLLILWLIPVSLAAQSADDTMQLFDRAVEVYQEGDYDQSKEIFEEASTTLCSNSQYMETCIDAMTYLSDIDRVNREFESAENILIEAEQILIQELETPHPLQLEINLQKVFLYVDMTDFEKAQQVADQSLELVDEPVMEAIPKARGYLASAHLENELGNFQQSLDTYTKALEVLDGLHQDREVLRFYALAYNNMGLLTRRMGDTQGAMDYFLEALEVTKSLYGENHPEVALVHNSIGTIYYFMGDYGRAADYFLSSADIFRANYGENHERVAGAYNNAGIVYMEMDNIEKAAEILERAQRIKESILGENHIDTAIGYSNLASIYMENENFEAALANYQKSIAVREEIYGSDHPNLITPYINISEFYTRTNEFTQAREYLSEALHITENRLGENHPDIWDILLNIGNTYEEEENFTTALENYQEAYDRIVGESGITSQNSFDTGRLSHPLLFVNATAKMGDMHMKLYESEGGQSKLHQAIEHYSASIKTVNFLQESYQSEASKLNLIDQNYSIFTNTMKAYNYLFEETGEESWLDEILATSELSRSRIALELLQDIEAKNFAGVPQQILNQESTINAEIARLYQQLHAEQEMGFEANQQTITAYRDSLFGARQELNNLTQQIEENYPEYYRLKYDESYADRETIEDLLNPDEALINYIVSENDVFALVLAQESITFHSLGSSDSLSTQIRSLRSSALSDSSEQYTELSHYLYRQLVEPVVADLDEKSLIIVPDQSLHYLPFEMLLTEMPQRSGYYNLPYLIREYQISYVSSGTVLQMLTQKKISNPKNLFAVAPFNESTARVEEDAAASRYMAGLNPLPLTRYETNEIAKIFDEPQTLREYIFPEEVEVLVGQEATKSTIQSRSLQNFAYLHFATHAFVNEEDPALSGIAFWGDQNDNGVMYVNDIYNMDLHADLVVLGACETGLGTVYKGEGMIGFTRAFTYAGASNLMVSMWKVNDQPTANLMIHFYRNMKEGYSYSESLRMAKMELINQPEFAAPRNWAAFVLQGR